MTDTIGTAYIASGDVAATIAVTTLSLYMQNQYNSLAKKYYNMYDGERQWYYDNFQDGGSDSAYTERGLLNYVMTTPLAGNGQFGIGYVPQYAAQRNKVISLASNRVGIDKWWGNHASMYSSPQFTLGYTPTGSLGSVGEPLSLEYEAIVADNTSYMYRYEEHRRDVYDERTWEWQNQALNFGLKQGNITQTGLATSFKFLDETSMGLSDWMATQANGLMLRDKYRGARYDTTQQLNAAAVRGRGLTSFGQSLGVDIQQRPTSDLTSYPNWD